MHSPLIGEIYAVAVLAGPVEDCGTYRAAAPVPTLPASCLLEPPPGRQNHRSHRAAAQTTRTTAAAARAYPRSDTAAATTASTDLSMNGTENWDRLPSAFVP